MKRLDVKRIIRVSAFASGLAVIAVLPTFAQSNANGRTDTNTTTRTVERDDDTDYGWLGLLGLAGLAGLILKKRQVEVHQNRDTNTNRTV